MERGTAFETGEIYHVYNRGIDKRNIFFSEGDWKHFQRLLYIKNIETEGKIHLSRLKNTSLCEMYQGSPGTLVEIIAYAMIDNHFHLLLREKVPGGITKFMSRLLTSHAMYMNKKYNRTGPLMCRPFRAKHVDNDAYVRWLLAYIHMNPLDKFQSDWKQVGIKNHKKAFHFIKNYHYSSYIDYFIDERDETLILNKGALPIDASDMDDLQVMFKILKTAR